MKNIVLKYYIATFYICSTFVMYGQPGDGNDTGNLEGPDAPAAPIDNYVWVLALVGLMFVFLKLRVFQNKKVHS